MRNLSTLPPSQRRYRWLQILLTIGLIVLTAGGVYVLVRDALNLNRVLGPVVLTHYAIVGELADLQRAILRMQVEVGHQLRVPGDDPQELAKRYATIKIQFNHTVVDFASPEGQLILNSTSQQLLTSLQGQIAVTDPLMEKLTQASATELAAVLLEFDNRLGEMDIVVKQLYEQQSQSQITSLGEASRIAQSSQLSLTLAGTALAIMGLLLFFFTRRALNTELQQAYALLQQEADRLQHLTGELQRRTAELHTVAEVSASVSAVLETGQFLWDVSNLTKERFGLYHSHIYLLNDAGDTLGLTAGAGEAGRQMVAEGRSIPLNREQSLVARAARERKGVIINDVTNAPDFLPNPLLPNTRSELAVPMIAGGKVIGVFDIQSDQVDRFTSANADIQTTLAAQIAVAVQNNRQFAQTRAQADLESLTNTIGQKIHQATSVEAVLQTAIREVGLALGATRVSAQLGKPAKVGIGSAVTV